MDGTFIVFVGAYWVDLTPGSSNSSVYILKSSINVFVYYANLLMLTGKYARMIL